MAKLQNWNPEDWGEGKIKHRPYQDLAEYLQNQKDAFSKRDKAKRRFSRDVQRFTENFREIPFLRGKKVLCLGCRTGAEVRALRDLRNNAYGIDIEPVYCDKTVAKYIQQGDFHKLNCEDGSYDVVYTNSFDHVFDLKRALNEIKRVLRPGGYFILDVVAGYEEGGHPGDHEAMYWATAEDFISHVEKHGFKRIHALQNVPYVKGLPFKRGVLVED